MSSLLTTYLQDHHAAAAATLSLFDRVASGHSDTQVRSAVETIGRAFRHDQTMLEALMADLGAPASTIKDTAAQVGEKIGRLKPNNHLVDRSPLSDLDELEALVLALQARVLMLTALAHTPDPDLRAHLSAEQAQGMIDEAVRQRDLLDELRLSHVTALTRD